MSGKIRVGGVVVDPNSLYNGPEVIDLCNAAFKNGMLTVKRTQPEIERALQNAYYRGYYEGKRAHRSDDMTSVLEALKVLERYFQNTID